MVESFREAGDEASGAAAPSAQEPEEREEAQLAGEAAQDGPPKKRERFFSKASRAAAMLFKAKERGKGRQQAELDADAEQTAAAAEHGHATRLAKWLTAWLQAALHSPPTQLPAASIFTCSKSAAVDCLSAAPREAIHSALIHPETYLYTASGSSGPVQQLGMSAKTEDACLAYQLFDQDSAYGNVADWFTAFKDVHDAADGIAGGSGEGGKEGKGKTTAKEKDKFNQAKGKGKGSGSNGASNMGQSDSKRVQELAARFSQAAAELQFVGLLRQAKRRRGEHVQRAVHMPADLMGE